MTGCHVHKLTRLLEFPKSGMIGSKVLPNLTMESFDALSRDHILGAQLWRCPDSPTIGQPALKGLHILLLRISETSQSGLRFSNSEHSNRIVPDWLNVVGFL